VPPPQRPHKLHGLKPCQPLQRIDAPYAPHHNQHIAAPGKVIRLAPTLWQAWFNTQGGWQTKTCRPCTHTLVYLHHADNHADIRDNLPRNCRVHNVKPVCDGSKGLAGGPSQPVPVTTGTATQGPETRGDNQDACTCVRKAAEQTCRLCCSSGSSAGAQEWQCSASMLEFVTSQLLSNPLKLHKHEHTQKQASSTDAFPTQSKTKQNHGQQLPRQHSCP
jgi:hypothetical protein